MAPAFLTSVTFRLLGFRVSKQRWIGIWTSKLRKLAVRAATIEHTSGDNWTCERRQLKLWTAIIGNIREHWNMKAKQLDVYENDVIELMPTSKWTYKNHRVATMIVCKADNYKTNFHWNWKCTVPGYLCSVNTECLRIVQLKRLASELNNFYTTHMAFLGPPHTFIGDLRNAKIMTLKVWKIKNSQWEIKSNETFNMNYPGIKYEWIYHVPAKKY